MRVAIVGEYPVDHTRIRGGVQAAFVYLVKGLSRLGELDLHVVTFTPGSWNGPNTMHQNGATLHLLPRPPRFERLRRHRTYQRMLSETLAEIQPDVVHAQSADVHAYVTLGSAYPHVATVHGIRSEDRKHYGSLGQRIRGYYDSRVIEQQVMRRTRHLIAISRYLTDYFASHFRADIQLHYIPNAIDNSFFRLAERGDVREPTRLSLRAEPLAEGSSQAGPNDGETILFAGRVIPAKRVLDLVKAFAQVVQQVPAAQLRIAGECQSERAYADAVRGFIQEAGLGGRVHLLGALAEDAIVAEFGRCGVLALPSAQENLPMVIGQAMAAGIPVVATRVGGVAEMVSDGKTGFLVNVGQVGELARTLTSLLRDPALRARMGHAGYEYAVANYRAEIVGQRTLEAYRQVAKDSPQRHQDTKNMKAKSA